MGAGLLDGHALLGAELGELLGVLFVLGAALGVDHGDAGDVDLLGIAQDDQVGEILFDDDLRCVDGALIFALGQDDGLFIRLGGGFHAAQEIAHVRSSE